MDAIKALKGIFEQSQQHVEKLRSTLKDIKDKSTALRQQRACLLDSALSREDFADFLCEDIDRKGQAYAHTLAAHINRPPFNSPSYMNHSLGNLDNVLKNDSFYLNYLAPLGLGNIVPEAFYFIMGDQVKVAIKRVVMSDAVKWHEEETISVEQRRPLIASLQEQINSLDAEEEKIIQAAANIGVSFQ